MSSSIHKRGLHVQTGLSLVELMVTLVLSLFIVLVTTGFYINNKTTYRFIDRSSEIQENGRFAIHFLRESIANAGFPLQSNLDPFPTAVALRPIDGAGTGPDRISVQYQSQTDCLGNAAPIVGTVQIATNVFTVDANNNLECNAMDLIPGVENLQVEYGIDTDGDAVANTYVRATDVQNGVLSTPDWNNVVAVRLAILVSSQAGVRDQASAENYQLLGTAITAANDKQLRRVFTTTIPLRNRGA